MTPGALPPPGYVGVRGGTARGFALAAVSGAVEEALARSGSLAGWAAASAERAIQGGRGPAWKVDLGGVPAVVRHYRRGGWMGPVLGDRYFDRPPRPFAELRVSEALRSAGVETPRVLAALAAPAGPGYRADLATEWLSPGLDLEEFLRPGLYPAAERRPAIEAAGRLVGRAHAAGLRHPDLRPRNVFLRPREPGRWDAALLDLDRAAIGVADRDAKKKTSSASGAPSTRSVARAA